MTKNEAIMLGVLIGCALLVTFGALSLVNWWAVDQYAPSFTH